MNRSMPARQEETRSRPQGHSYKAKIQDLHFSILSPACAGTPWWTTVLYERDSGHVNWGWGQWKWREAEWPETHLCLHASTRVGSGKQCWYPLFGGWQVFACSYKRTLCSSSKSTFLIIFNNKKHKSYHLFLTERSDQSLSHVWLFATPWIAARQASLSITNSQSSLRLTSIESVMPLSHLILCSPLLLLPPIPPSISLFQWVNSSHEVAKVLEFQL